mgnify:CR=1 FL=1
MLAIGTRVVCGLEGRLSAVVGLAAVAELAGRTVVVCSYLVVGPVPESATGFVEPDIAVDTAVERGQPGNLVEFESPVDNWPEQFQSPLSAGR